MFTTPKSLLILSFLITIVNSTPRPGTQDFDLVFDDALDTNMFLDGVSNNDDIMASAPLMDMFDSDLTVDATPFMDQENLFALDTRPGSSCSAEDSQLLPAIGRLRRREGGESCVSPTKQRSDEGVDLFLQRLPIVGDAAKPKLRSRRDICPELIFGFRDIALCSAADTQIRRTIENTYIVTVSEAFFCMSSIDPGRGFRNRVWGFGLLDP